MKKLLAITSLLSLLAGNAWAQSPLWRDAEGKPLPESPSRRSEDGFAGSVVLTTDADWKEKWETPADSKPTLTVVEKIGFGKTVTLLIFFSNAKRDGAGEVNVRCDLSMVDPSGKTTVLKKDAVCHDGLLAGPATNLYLSRPVVAMSFEAGDVPGAWSFDVILRDQVRNLSLPLRTTIELN